MAPKLLKQSSAFEECTAFVLILAFYEDWPKDLNYKKNCQA